MQIKYRFSSKIKILGLTIFLILILANIVTANNSLWTGEKADIYEDRSQFSEGDVITVIIDEAASALQSADTDSRKSSNIEGGSSTGIFDFFGNFGLNFSDEETADGSTSRHGNFEAKIVNENLVKVEPEE